MINEIMILLIILLVLVTIFIIGTLICYISELVGLIRARGVPYVPLSRKQLEELNEYIELNCEDKVVDLGCGDGRVLRAFEKQGVKDLTGYEVNFRAYLLAKIRNKLAKSKAKIYFKNFKKVDLSEFNLVFCYLFPGCVNSLKEKFDRELKSGARVISFVFEIKNWGKPEIIYINNKNNKLRKLFIYTL